MHVRLNINDFPSNSDYHSCNTRNSAALSISAQNLSLFERSPNFIVLKLYNKCEIDLRPSLIRLHLKKLW
nr:unnamed protein product [Callosobruchus analis]